MGRHEEGLSKGYKPGQYILAPNAQSVSGKLNEIQESEGMIFVTVGTHEQPFNRLVECVDNLKHENKILEDVIIQTGYSTYEPKYCIYSKLFSYKDMVKYVNDAHIVITHGGPASFIMPLQIGKIPIVVPRQHKYGEHVNDHQVDFVNAVSRVNENILPIMDIGELEYIILSYDEKVKTMQTKNVNHNEEFNRQFMAVIKDLWGGVL